MPFRSYSSGPMPAGGGAVKISPPVPAEHKTH
jgi:hypothetical protein